MLLSQHKLFSDQKRSLEACFHDIRKWMCTNMLKLNEDKTELLLLLGSPYNLKDVNCVNVRVGSSNVSI